MTKPGPFRCPEREARAHELYHRGLNDGEIAEDVNVPRSHVAIWRKFHGHPAHIKKWGVEGPDGWRRITDEDRRRGMALLTKGVRNRVVHEVLGIPFQTVGKWRMRIIAAHPHLRKGTGSRQKPLTFPSGRRYSPLRMDRRRQVLSLYADGLPDPEIAKATGITRQQVHECRTYFELPPNIIERPTPAPKAKPLGPAITPYSNRLYARIAAAVGGGVAPDIAEDAMSEIFLAVASGEIREDEIEANARRFRNRVVSLFASRFGPMSMDEARGDDGSFTLHDALADPTSMEPYDDILERRFAAR